MLSGTQALVPKLGDVLQVIALGRISTIHQDAENIEASYRYIEEFLSRSYAGKLDIQFLGEQASGMSTERATIREAEERIATGTIDLVIAEDLSRIYRNPRHQYNFVQDAVDVGTRVICVGDNLDTADENWEITMGAAALRHGLHIPDTRRRVRRTATHSFHKGGMVQKIRYGYRKLTPEEAASALHGSKDLRIVKRPECTAVIRELMQRVLAGESYAAITDRLNAQGIEPGPYVTSGRWSPRLLAEFLADPILSGTRTFRDTICRPVFKTGRHKSSKNAAPEKTLCPELAHLTPDEHEALLSVMAARSIRFRVRSNDSSPRCGLPRSRSFWPGQALTCGVCGGLLYLSGRYLRCARSLPRNGGRCWNRIQVSRDLVRLRFIQWLLEFTAAHPDCLRPLIDLVTDFSRPITLPATDHRRDRERQIKELERQAQNLTQAIAAGGQLQSLVVRLSAIEGELSKLRKSTKSSSRRTEAKAVKKTPTREQLPGVLLRLMAESFEFATWLRRLVPAFVVQPIEALDTPLVRPRGVLTVRTALLAQPDSIAAGDATLSVTLDLFEPPVHIRFHSDCLALRAKEPTLSGRAMAERLGINAMTVKRAFDYLRRMEAAGVTEPYHVITSAPTAASRWHRRTARPASV